jgi:hypothetical protein
MYGTAYFVRYYKPKTSGVGYAAVFRKFVVTILRDLLSFFLLKLMVIVVNRTS